jgi:predicted XRE-type DNA-binding protein
MTYSMKRRDRMVTRSAQELARVLDLDPEDAIEIEVRSSLVDRIVAAVTERRLTHAQVARLAHTSRTRITAILNRNTEGVSTDLLLRILGRLGYRARIVVTRAA